MVYDSPPMANEEKKPLGSILLARKLISPEVLSQALRDQRQSGGGGVGGGNGMPLASFLVERGVVREEDALRALSEQFGVPGIELRQLAILLEHIAVIPRELAETQLILPVLLRGERLFVATANPSDKRSIDELEFVTGKKVYAYVALAAPLRRTIAAAYSAKSAGEVYYLGPRAARNVGASRDRAGHSGSAGSCDPRTSSNGHPNPGTWRSPSGPASASGSGAANVAAQLRGTYGAGSRAERADHRAGHGRRG